MSQYPVNEVIGHYNQRMLEGMGYNELRAVRKMAHRRFNAHYATHDGEPFGYECEECEYFELLCGACDDLIVKWDANLKAVRARNRARNRRLRESVLRDLGMRKVRGSRGGTYWE